MATILKKSVSSFGNFICSSFLSPKLHSKPQVAGLVLKALRDENYEKPVPFPYKQRQYGMLEAFFDGTKWRMDENSKIIVVDGPIASGKAKIAQKIAEDFDLHYIPHANLDNIYINSYGYDIRTLNDEMPFMAKTFEPRDFHANPHDRRSAMMQLTLFQIRLEQYLDALAHVFSTGQGVVLNRSVYSDFVFMEAHHKFGFLPKTFKSYYESVWTVLQPDILRPHLVIYIDTPVDVIRDRLVKRNDPVLIKSPALQPDVLKELERVYKHKFLKEIGIHAELLVYDGSGEVDPEIVIEDMERVNLDCEEGAYAQKMRDWRLDLDMDWNERRRAYTSKRGELEVWAYNIPPLYCPEAILTVEEALQYNTVKAKLPGNQYEEGYNVDQGDPHVAFKF